MHQVTPPLTWTWSGGASGLTAVYTWTAPGLYTPTVHVAGRCGQATDTLTVTAFCQPVEGVAPAGPSALLAGQAATWTVALQPITASRPLTLSWDDGTTGLEAIYRWALTGTYTVTVTATNGCGGVQVGSQQVKVLAEWPYWLYLPMLAMSPVRR